MYKYIFLDLDDTIWDFYSNAKDSLHEAFDVLKMSRYFDDFEHFFHIYITRNNELWDLYGNGEITKDFLMKERFRYPLMRVGVENDKLADKLSEIYLDILPTKKKMVSHARELLDYLFNKYPMTIVSNGFIEIQHKKLNHSGIKDYFRHVVLSEEAKALKPDKRIFEYALNLNQAKPEETIMIGDIYQADIVGAQNAGIDQIFYNWRKRELKEDESATYVVDSLKEIVEIL